MGAREARHLKLTPVGWKNLQQNIPPRKIQLKLWFQVEEASDCGSIVVNLDNLVEVEFGKEVEAVIILARCNLGWEGTLKEAKIYVHPMIRDVISNKIFEFHEYLAHISRSMLNVPVSYADVFEWLCLKRLQDLFAQPSTPQKILQPFFGPSTNFGRYPDVCFSEDVVMLPKVTDKAI
ncbi:hypothetical protein PC116_g11680 [Phytophthora cactorum]|nr:hypothetical protein PC116_g11680 [Phytophthora cactorum]RAW37635.1 hypothetical protein PC110_g6102 [Phytophthora cactorum]